MKIADEQAFEHLNIRDVAVHSGVRPQGRSVVRLGNGRPCHGLLYIWNGEATFTEQGRRTVIRNGELLYIPKSLRYKMTYSAEQTTFVLVNFNLMADADEPSLFDGLTVVAKDNDTHRIAAIMAKFEMCSVSRGIPTLFRRMELFYRLLSVIGQERADLFTEQGAASKIFAGVMLLKQSYLENRPVADYANACHMSISSFREHFLALYGTSPIAYRTRLRIERAALLLGEGSCTVTEAAYASGFQNIGYFCKCYKKQMGHSPGQAHK